LQAKFLAQIEVKILFFFSLKKKRLQRIAGLAPKNSKKRHKKTANLARGGFCFIL